MIDQKQEKLREMT